MPSKSLSEIRFPIYPLREYQHTEEKDGIVYIYTAKDIYILDDKTLDVPSYAKRRLHIKGNKYPLTYTITSSNGLIEWVYNNRTKKKFIDNSGNIFTLKAKKFYNIDYRVVKDTRIKDGAFVFKIGNIAYQTRDTPRKFAKVVEMGAATYILGFADEIGEAERIKL